MRDNNFMYFEICGADIKRKGLLLARIEKDFAAAADVAFRASRGDQLPVDCFSPPSIPKHLGVDGRRLEQIGFPVKENEYLIFKYHQQIAELISVVFVGIWIAPQF